MERQEMIDRLLEPMAAAFDGKEAMISRDYQSWVGGYHTRRTGITHVVRDTADYAAAALLLRQERHYDRAFRALRRICALQETRPAHPAFGLWSYYLEEDLEHMRAPDYNWSDFIGKNLIGVCALRGELLPDGLRDELLGAVGNAMECSVRRNVAADYTNMSIMSSMTITAAGELLRDRRLLEIGAGRLEKLYEYTVFNGAFSEYNSSAYVLVAMNEIMRMLAFFQDGRCREIASELNRCAWRGLAQHYNLSIGQLTPPQARAYRDLDNGSLAWAVWQGTGGRYGRKPSRRELEEGAVSLESLCFPPECPEELFPLFEERERFLEQTYYRKNKIRSAGEDMVIIREPDSPDLKAYSYRTSLYSLGAFGVSDCWAQRRNVMAVWDRERPKYLRLRCMNGQYDFCSGAVYAAQDRNLLLGNLGLFTDRGSFHYILDEVMDGRYETKALYFKFELGGALEGLRMREVKAQSSGGENAAGAPRIFRIRDGRLSITLRIERWIVDGRPGEVSLNADGTELILILYRGPERLLDTKQLAGTYGVFGLAVEELEDTPGSESGMEDQAEENVGMDGKQDGAVEGIRDGIEDEMRTGILDGKQDGIVNGNLDGAADEMRTGIVDGIRVEVTADGRVISAAAGLRVTSPVRPVSYRKALEFTCDR